MPTVAPKGRAGVASTKTTTTAGLSTALRSLPTLCLPGHQVCQSLAHAILHACLTRSLAVRRLPKRLDSLAIHVGYPELPSLIRYFLYEQLVPDSGQTGVQAGLDACPTFNGRLKVFPSAVAMYYAPSDPAGVKGMRKERIRAVQSWRGGRARRDCVYVLKDATLPGFRGLHAARAQLFFSFDFHGHTYECALVSWYSPVGDTPDADTGMWVVEPDMELRGRRRELRLQVIDLKTIVRAAHLIGVSGEDFLPLDVGPDVSLDVFRRFYLNKYADHHAHEIAF